MNKYEFLNALRKRLIGIPQADIDRSMEYYSELIDDRIEEGMSETEAVADLPTIDEIVAQIVGEVPLTKLVGEKLKPKRRLKGWEIGLLIIGSPLWISALVIVFSLAIAAFAVVWSLVIALGAVMFAFAVAGIAQIAAGLGSVFSAQWANGLMLMGTGIFLIGLVLLLLGTTRKLPEKMLVLTKKILLWIKKLFVKEERR